MPNCNTSKHLHCLDWSDGLRLCDSLLPLIACCVAVYVPLVRAGAFIAKAKAAVIARYCRDCCLEPVW